MSRIYEEYQVENGDGEVVRVGAVIIKGRGVSGRTRKLKCGPGEKVKEAFPAFFQKNVRIQRSFKAEI